MPSNVPLVSDLGASEAIRAKYAVPADFWWDTSALTQPGVSKYLETALPRMLQDARVNVILLGRGSGPFREAMIRRHPHIADRLHATDGLANEEVSVHLSACDLMIQPYPDGISTRRTSAMAALLHGKPVVTTSGRLTEPLWSETGAVAAVPADDPGALAPLAARLLEGASERQLLAEAGLQLYQERFDLRHTIKALRNPDADCDSQLVQP